MRLDEPFPLEAVPPRLQNAILNQFQGRCPSIGEVARIPDKQWLSTPELGQRSVEIIHDITDAVRQKATRALDARLTDAELFKHLEWLQKELRWLQNTLKVRTFEG
jgi:hypothetical protein